MDRENFKIYGQSRIGKNAMIGERVIIGYPTADILRQAASSGKNIEDLDFMGAVIGDNVLIGTNTIVDGHTAIGSNVSIQGNVYVPLNVTIEDNVFIGPCAVLTNDKYPIRKRSEKMFHHGN